MSLAISSFLLLEYSFLSNFFDILYVWSNSEKTLPIIYKIVAIWAGESGSIMTWMMFNSIVIFFFRIKNQDKDDMVFIRSVIISLIISTVFLVILFFFFNKRIERSTIVKPIVDNISKGPRMEIMVILRSKSTKFKKSGIIMFMKKIVPTLIITTFAVVFCFNLI